jgi:phage baseplate assembly protein W
MAIYRGFSTKNWLENKSFKLSDIEAIKSDLRNHIFTRLGERIMMPNFGTRIPDMAFEPNDETTIRIIRDDILKVIEYDPRVQLISIDIMPVPDNNAIIVIVEVLYVELDVQDVINIDVKSGSLT